MTGLGMIDKDGVLEELLQGVLLYRGNKLVRRLQGKFSEMDEKAQMFEELMQEQMKSTREDVVRLGKRTFSQKNKESQMSCLIANLFKHSGVISVFPHVSQTSIDKTVSENYSINVTIYGLSIIIGLLRQRCNGAHQRSRRQCCDAGHDQPAGITLINQLTQL